MATELVHRRITVDEYHKMAEAGILSEDEHTELIDGEIIQMSAVGGRHVETVRKLNHQLVRASGDEWGVNVQSPISMPPYGEPEPDLAVVKNRPYGGRLPQPEDTLLVMEVSDTSLTYDQETKLPMYAEKEIPEAWIADIKGRTLKRHSEPINGIYTLTKTAGLGMEIESTVLPGLKLRVDEILDA